MKALLDTHAFLWWVTNDAQLSQTAKDTIANPDNTIIFSVINAWEIIIKQGTDKLSLPEPAETYIPSRITANQLVVLPVQLPYILQVSSLPDLHRDPFDRLLVAQSQVEQIPIISVDRFIRQYPVSVIW
ncbi:type II toxin-antitoxin system VapC family toxin [filamentous cyanobacterium LEGE 11480]|uniref:Type II toxin-antitoxin system VapC family toxin n=1 Tax=Romeriopsis navalis LEGE 11480 TaxID=2777977 RepID=A0A928VPS2_9CYAN|nr:type II toxin-antitoxin system VapC family toxin [Romeriopsis navalis]MBE9030656.1 type II toxin-antitoxin system VapC family toxin [Romeriopsis navalis LEGE 11480]